MYTELCFIKFNLDCESLSSKKICSLSRDRICLFEFIRSNLNEQITFLLRQAL